MRIGISGLEQIMATAYWICFESVWKGRIERARSALELRFKEEHTRLAIANHLQITEHGAKNLMQRAKKQLRDCVEHKKSGGIQLTYDKHTRRF